MAYTKILVIHNRLDKCVDYALNEEKTSLSAAINCDVATAYQDMLDTKRRCRGSLVFSPTGKLFRHPSPVKATRLLAQSCASQPVRALAGP